MGASHQPLAYAMGADGGCRQAVARSGFPLAPNSHTIYAGDWGLTNRLAGERITRVERGKLPKGQGGAGWGQLPSDFVLWYSQAWELAACLQSRGNR